MNNNLGFKTKAYVGNSEIPCFGLIGRKFSVIIADDTPVLKRTENTVYVEAAYTRYNDGRIVLSRPDPKAEEKPKRFCVFWQSVDSTERKNSPYNIEESIIYDAWQGERKKVKDQSVYNVYNLLVLWEINKNAEIIQNTPSYTEGIVYTTQNGKLYVKYRGLLYKVAASGEKDIDNVEAIAYGYYHDNV